MRSHTHVVVALAAGMFLSFAKPQAAQPSPDKDKKTELNPDEFKPIVIKGQLTDDDPRDSVKVNCAHKVHVVKLLAGLNYQIDMIKKDEKFDVVTGKRSMDPFLRIEDAKQVQLAEDDDSGGNFNARIVFSPPKDGDYRLIATTLLGTGEYTLKVVALPRVPVVKGLMKFEDKLAANDKWDEARPNCFCKVFVVKMNKGKTYTIDMVSRDVDSYLRLEDSKKNRLAEDDDGGGFPNARIVHQPQASGEFRVIATTFAPNTVGAFTLTVRED